MEFMSSLLTNVAIAGTKESSRNQSNSQGSRKSPAEREEPGEEQTHHNHRFSTNSI